MELFAKKSLGQHFLNSTHVLEQIIAASEIQKGESVLEIGPGTGILTKRLLESGARVIAVEMDDRAIGVLKDKFATDIVSEQLDLIHEDILELRKKPSFGHYLADRSPYALIANIPYYITGAILQSFLEGEIRPNRAVLLVQKEVADRIMARDGKESILSVSVKAFGEPKMVAKVSKGAFTPPPTVDSAILAIHKISDSQFTARNLNIRHFFTVVQAGFAHKRKFLIRNLEDVTSAGELGEVWQKLSLDPKVRAEDISVSTWLDIASHISEKKSV
jgi:16S rRNA (adenine1518-N6/adenine1519-N6)-dimethyltransferase